VKSCLQQFASPPIGQDGYDRLRPLSYPDSDVILVCFSVVDPDTLENVEERWISEVWHFCEGLPILPVGCKKELRDDQMTIEELAKLKEKPVSQEEGNKVARKIGALKYMECSAKTGEGVKEVFEDATRAALLPKAKKKKGCLIL